MAGKRGKLKSNSNGPPLVKPTSSDNQSDADTAEYAYEMELSWCIQKLKLGLSSSSASQNKKQAEEASRIVRILENPKAAKPKKRQLMFAAFGDYREKMKKEAKAFANKLPKHEAQIQSSSCPRAAVVRSVSSQDKSIVSDKVEHFSFDFTISEEK